MSSRWSAFIALVLLGACTFDERVGGLAIRCQSDGECPAGHTCAAGLKQCSSRATPATDISIAPARVRAGQIVTVRLRAAVPKVSFSLRAVAADGAALGAFQQQAGDAELQQFAWTAADATRSETVFVLADATTATTTESGVLLGTVQLDNLGPSLQALTVERILPPDPALVGGFVTAVDRVTRGSEVSLRLVSGEPLRAPPSLALDPLACALVDGMEQTYRFRCTLDGAGTPIEGPVGARVRLEDDLGNATDVERQGLVRIDTTAPSVPSADDRCVYRREPLGSFTSDAGSRARHSLRAAQGTFEPDSLLVVWTGPIDIARAMTADGGLPEQELAVLRDEPTVELQVVDRAGNASPRFEVKEVEVVLRAVDGGWLASGDSMANAPLPRRPGFTASPVDALFSADGQAAVRRSGWSARPAVQQLEGPQTAYQMPELFLVSADGGIWTPREPQSLWPGSSPAACLAPGPGDLGLRLIESDGGGPRGLAAENFAGVCERVLQNLNPVPAAPVGATLNALSLERLVLWGGLPHDGGSLSPVLTLTARLPAPQVYGGAITWGVLDAGLPPRTGQAAAADLAEGVAVLHGGRSPTGALLDDTWVFDGTTVRRHLGPGPSARQGAAMTWDPLRQRLILYGGLGPNGALSDTWAWSSNGWALLAGAGQARGPGAVGYDTLRGQVMLQTSSPDGGSAWRWAEDAGWSPLAPELDYPPVGWEAATGVPGRREWALAFPERFLVSRGGTVTEYPGQFFSFSRDVAYLDGLGWVWPVFGTGGGQRTLLLTDAGFIPLDGGPAVPGWEGGAYGVVSFARAPGRDGLVAAIGEFAIKPVTLHRFTVASGWVALPTGPFGTIVDDDLETFIWPDGGVGVLIDRTSLATLTGGSWNVKPLRDPDGGTTFAISSARVAQVGFDPVSDAVLVRAKTGAVSRLDDAVLTTLGDNALGPVLLREQQRPWLWVNFPLEAARVPAAATVRAVTARGLAGGDGPLGPGAELRWWNGRDWRPTPSTPSASNSASTAAPGLLELYVGNRQLAGWQGTQSLSLLLTTATDSTSTAQVTLAVDAVELVIRYRLP